MNTNITLEEFASLFETETEAHWKRTSKALLLSNLGVVLKNKGIDSRSVLNGKKLADFINESLVDKVQLVSSPLAKLVHGLIPANVKQYDLTEIFSKPVEDALVLPTSKSREHNFNRGLWKAFSEDVATGNQRVINLIPKIKFFDIKENEEVPPNYFQLPRLSIVTKTDQPISVERNSRIQENILAWATIHGINIDTIIDSRQSEGYEYSLYELIIEMLTDNEKERLIIPIDIVEKLRRNNVKILK